MVDGVPAKRTYVLDGIDEIPMELVQHLGAELREFMNHEPEAHFVFTARQAFYFANRNLLPPVPAVFHILPFATEDIEQYCANAGIDPDRFMEAIHGVSAS
jgi:predicted NACHT family NTPase